MLACTLYLLNYVLPYLWLSGMADSAEACLLPPVMLALFSDRWWLLPLGLREANAAAVDGGFRCCAVGRVFPS